MKPSRGGALAPRRRSRPAARLGRAIGDVVGDLAPKMTGSCGTRAMRARSAAGSTSAMSTPSSSTAPARRIVEAHQQLEDRRLAGARRADDGDASRPARREGSTPSSTGSSRPRRIGEADALEGDLAARRRRQRQRRGGRDDARLASPAFRRSAPRRRRPAETSLHTSDSCAERAGAEHGVEQELRQRAARHACPPAHPARRATARRRRWRRRGRSRPR